ncbi:MAG: hypothetical protein IBJ10_07320 [Phycisphaerales bacterium]|nr:hypothetical protein [Phycisphaerales bacterium]
MSPALAATLVLAAAPPRPAAGSLLAWRPFLDPLPSAMHDYWWLLLVPLAFFIAWSYKAVRLASVEPIVTHFLPRVFAMTAQIILGVVGIGLAMYLFIEVVAPRL